MASVNPSSHTAAIAGGWSGLGATFTVYMAEHGYLHSTHVFLGLSVGIILGTVFSLLPAYYLVIGSSPGGTNWHSLRERAERERFFATLFRVLIYVVSALVVGMLCWLILDRVLLLQD